MARRDSHRSIENHGSLQGRRRRFVVTLVGVTLVAVTAVGPADATTRQSPSRLLRTKPTAPAPKATAGHARVTLAWTPPMSSGGSAITRYALQRSTSRTNPTVCIERYPDPHKLRRQPDGVGCES
jgi:hypothetical protein